MTVSLQISSGQFDDIRVGTAIVISDVNPPNNKPIYHSRNHERPPKLLRGTSTLAIGTVQWFIDTCVFFIRSKLLVGSGKRGLSTLLNRFQTAWMRSGLDTSHHTKQCNCLLPLTPSVAALEVHHSSDSPSHTLLPDSSERSPVGLCLGLYHLWPYNLNGIVLHSSMAHNKASDITVIQKLRYCI